MSNLNKKVGRNEPCPCGSGKKYKKCHGNVDLINTSSSFPLDIPDIEKRLKQIEAEEVQRTKQQGKGRPIVSTVFQGYRFVAVGNKFYYSKTWKTFHDFLAEYVKILFGKEWGASEQKKALENRHPILHWTNSIREYREKVIGKNKNEIVSSPMTGAVFAYLTLAYNLYLIAHNTQLVHRKGLHERLIERLKNIDSFNPAFYETLVAASFIKAGFQIELENEEDPTSSHAEFTATSLKTNKRYSVEAKHRIKGKGHTAIRNQLYNALKKDLPHERIVFINLNVTENITYEGRLKWLDDVIQQMREGEKTMTIKRKPAPQAYIVVTNHPFLYNLDSFNFPPAAVAEGFKIPDFKLDTAFSNLREALQSRENHIDMLDLIKGMKEYDQIPCTFGGEIPEYEFGQIKEPRLKVGNKYLVPNASGKEVLGILEDTIVMETEKKVWGFYRLSDGQKIVVSDPLYDREFEAFKQYPNTFFGVYKKHKNEAKDPLDLFDFFFKNYGKTPKEKLLKFMEGHHDYQKLKNEPQEELAFIYCERLVYSMMSKKSQHPSK